MDYSRCVLSGKYYTGAERKKGILIDGEAYIVKYAKLSPEGMTYSHILENALTFWDMYIIDAWIGNLDRHGANWGSLRRSVLKV